MKGTKDFPQCCFSYTVLLLQILRSQGGAGFILLAIFSDVPFSFQILRSQGVLHFTLDYQVNGE
jgi:glutaredoxin-related protein